MLRILSRYYIKKQSFLNCFKKHLTTASEESPVLSKVTEEGITVITINRPEKRNCVNFETAKLLKTAFEEFDADNNSYCAVLHGKGGNFCAGYDLEELSNFENTENRTYDLDSFRGPMGPSQMLTSKPVIAAIDGYAVAGGLELALLCDLRIMEENAILGVFCRRFGVPLIDGGTVRLPKIVGLGRALDIILSGRSILAKEALDMGLVNHVTAVGTAFGRAYKYAMDLQKFPQECLKADRRSAYYSAFEAKSLDDALKFEYENGLPIVAEESIKGAKRFAKDKIGRHGKFSIVEHEPMLKVTV